MKVRELIEELQKLDQEREVILQKDAEGNGHSPLACLSGDNDCYIPECTWSGWRSLERLTSELEKEGYSKDDVYDGDDAVKAVFLIPIN